MTNDGFPRIELSNPLAVQALKKLLDELKVKPPASNIKDWNLDQLAAAKSTVVSHYGPAFSSQNVGKLTRETFLAFLQSENNRHWRGLDRHGDNITNDMSRLRLLWRCLSTRASRWGADWTGCARLQAKGWFPGSAPRS